MKNKVLVSIIIPVYNVEKYLETCIESCFYQDYDNIEIIAINDGSTDSSNKILDRLAKKDHRLIVVTRNNGGVSSARNQGLSMANGEYIVFVDADDYLSNDAISYMLEVVEKTKAEFGIMKNCFNSQDQNQIESIIKSISNEYAIELLLGLSMELGCWNKIYLKDMLKKNKILFDEKSFYGEGLQFILDVAQKANKIGLGTKCVYYYRKNNLSSATSRFNYQKFDNGEKSLMKVKEKLGIVSNRIDDIWKFHYTMFAQSALVSCIINKKNLDDYKSIYKKWKRKFTTYYKDLLKSKNISKKDKSKLIIIRYFPRLFTFIRIIKTEKMVERSV